MLVWWEDSGEGFSGEAVTQFALAHVGSEGCVDYAGLIGEVVFGGADSFACVDLVRYGHFNPCYPAVTIWVFVLTHGFDSVAGAPVECGDPCLDWFPHVVR